VAALLCLLPWPAAGLAAYITGRSGSQSSPAAIAFVVAFVVPWGFGYLYTRPALLRTRWPSLVAGPLLLIASYRLIWPVLCPSPHEWCGLAGLLLIGFVWLPAFLVGPLACAADAFIQARRWSHETSGADSSRPGP
jgi:hypothetical protein